LRSDRGHPTPRPDRKCCLPPQGQSIDREAPSSYLGCTEQYAHSDQTTAAQSQLLHALRVLGRWHEDEGHEELSDYMLAAEARVLAEQITPELRY